MSNTTKPVIHVVRITKNANEGGSVRDYAFHRCLSLHDWITTLSIGKHRLLNALRIASLIGVRRRVLLLHISSSGLPILNNLIVGRLACKLYVAWLRYIARRNTVFLEFNDLFVEQAKDLELRTPRNFAKIEADIFAIRGLRFIFASESMRKFACSKHKLRYEETLAIPNGEFEPIEAKPAGNSASSETIEYVYAGTLNKGRAIEELIEIFKDSSANLTLIGTHGEWILQEHNIPQNIRYLPPIPGELLPRFLRSFDVGIIPYPSDKEYYHIAYPTKLSTYIVSGLTFLATPVKEVERAISQFPGIGFTAPIATWRDFIKTASRTKINGAKLAAALARPNFTWERQIEPLIHELQQLRCEPGSR